MAEPAAHHIETGHPSERDYRKIMTVLLSIIVLIGVVFVLYELYEVLLPLVLASLLSLMFKPVLHALRKRGVPLAVCVVIVLLLVAGIFGIIYLIVLSTVESMAAQAPRYQESLNSVYQQAMTFIDATLSRFGSTTPAKSQIAQSFQLSSVTSFLASGAGQALNLVVNITFTILFLVFLLLGSEDFASKISRAFSSENSARVSQVLYQINKDIRRYLVTKTLINAIVGVITGIVALSFGLDFALFSGVLAFALNYIPNFGALIATLFPALVSILQFQSLGLTVLLLAVLATIHSIIGNFFEPKLMGSNLHLSPLVVLLSLVFWEWVWGVWGMVLAIPIISIVKIVCENVTPLRPIAILISSAPAKKERARK